MAVNKTSKCQTSSPSLWLSMYAQRLDKFLSKSYKVVCHKMLSPALKSQVALYHLAWHPSQVWSLSKAPPVAKDLEVSIYNGFKILQCPIFLKCFVNRVGISRRQGHICLKLSFYTLSFKILLKCINTVLYLSNSLVTKIKLISD